MIKIYSMCQLAQRWHLSHVTWSAWWVIWSARRVSWSHAYQSHCNILSRSLNSISIEGGRLMTWIHTRCSSWMGSCIMSWKGLVAVCGWAWRKGIFINWCYQNIWELEAPLSELCSLPQWWCASSFPWGFYSTEWIRLPGKLFHDIWLEACFIATTQTKNTVWLRRKYSVYPIYHVARLR